MVRELKQTIANIEASASRGKNARPLDSLKPVILRMLALGIVSSGVEQNFAKGAWVFSSRQAKGSLALEESTFKFSIDVCMIGDQQARDEIIDEAQHIYVECFGATRTWTGSRIDKGCKRKQEQNESSPESGDIANCSV